MHKLSDRMMMNVGLIPANMRVADIGCDHGWVSIYLMEQGIASHVIAMDVASGPLNMAREHVVAAGLEDAIDIRLSDGADELKYSDSEGLEVDVILMAGIGGHLGIKLIENNLDKYRAAKYIVLQIQSDYYFVRKRLNELGFSFDDEDIVFDEGKYYFAMRLKYTGQTKDYREEELLYGPVLLEKKDATFLTYLKFKKEGYEKIVAQMKKNQSEDKRLKEIISEIELIERCIEQM